MRELPVCSASLKREAAFASFVVRAEMRRAFHLSLSNSASASTNPMRLCWEAVSTTVGKFAQSFQGPRFRGCWHENGKRFRNASNDPFESREIVPNSLDLLGRVAHAPLH